jgi:hypothetical protein
MSEAQGDCPGCANARPRELVVAELDAIPKVDRKAIETSPGRALICSYCGCVYKINIPCVIFGYLNNPLKGKGWIKEGTALSE